MIDAPCSFMIYEYTCGTTNLLSFPIGSADNSGCASRYTVSGWIKATMNFGSA
jgi:hypothetical protein